MRTSQLLFACSWIISTGVLAGCSGDDTTGTSGGGAASNGLTGTAIDIYDTGTAKETVPVSMTKWASLQAIVEKDGEFTSYPGSIAADGKVEIPDVPEGPYWLAIEEKQPANLPGAVGFKHFLLNTSRTLDLGSLHSHRKDLEAITKPTFLDINATLTKPWKSYTEDDMGNVVQGVDDYLAVVSRSADVNGPVPAFVDDEFQTGAPTNGATALSWKIDAKGYFQGYSDSLPHLVRGDKGDDFALVHTVTTKVATEPPPPTPGAWDDYTFGAAAEVFRPASFTMTEGGTVKLDGSFEALPAKTFSLNYKGSLFEKLLADAPSKPTDTFVSFDISVEHGVPDHAVGGYPTLLDFSVSYLDTFPGDYAHDFTYGNPLSAGQELAALAVYFTSPVGMLLTDDMTSESLQGSITISLPSAEMSGAPVEPIVSLPRNVKVNGQPTPVDKLTTGVGVTPEISFEPPTMGSPTRYTVRIRDLDDIKDAGGNVLRRSRLIASLSLPGDATGVKIPDGVLQTGKHYYVQVMAWGLDVPDLSSPFRYATRVATATTYTGVIVP